MRRAGRRKLMRSSVSWRNVEIRDWQRRHGLIKRSSCRIGGRWRMAATIDERLAEMIDEEMARLDALLAAEVAEVEAAAIGIEHLPRTQEIVDAFRARVASFREERRDILEAALRSAANRLN